MTKQTLSIALSLTAAFGIALSANASPVDVADQANGMLSSTMTQAPAQDPVIQQAVKLIRAKHASSSFHVVPKNTSAHRDLDKVQILGYPETILM